MGIFIPQGLFVPLNSTRTKMNRFEVTGFIPHGQGLLLARGGGEALTSSKRCLKAVTGGFLWKSSINWGPVGENSTGKGTSGDAALPLAGEEKDSVTFYLWTSCHWLTSERWKGQIGARAGRVSPHSCKTKKGTKDLLSWAPLKLKTGEGARRAVSHPLIPEPSHWPAWSFMEKQLSLGSHHGCLRARFSQTLHLTDLMFCSKVNYQSSGQPRSVTAARDLGHQPPNKTGIYFQDTLCLSRILQKRPCKSAKIMFYHSDAQETLAGHVPRQRTKITNEQSEGTLSQGVGSWWYWFLFFALCFFHNVQVWLLLIKKEILHVLFKSLPWDFAGGPVAKILSSQCRAPGFHPRLRNWIPHATAKTWHSQINEQK